MARLASSLNLRSVWYALRKKPLFIIWPFGALCDSIRHFRSPYSIAIAWLFCIYFGFVFIYDDPFAIGGSDSARYAADLIKMHYSSASFHSVISKFYNQNTQGRIELDIYQGLITWLVSCFTGNPRWLFTLFAAVFGYFYCRNIWLVLENVSNELKVGVTWALFALVFALVNPIWNINGARMYTAIHVFCFGTLLFIMNKDWRGLVWAGLSVLIHFSLIFPFFILIIFHFIPKNLTVLIIVFFVCAFMNIIDLNAVRKVLSFMPDIFTDRTESYTRDAYMIKLAEKNARLSAHVQVANYCRNLIMYFVALVPYLHRNLWLDYRPFLERLYAFALFFGSFALLIAHIPSAWRMLTIADFFLLACFIIILSHRRFARAVSRWVLLFMPVATFYFLFQVRFGLDNSSIMTLFGNPFLAFLVQSDAAALDLIKSFIGL